MKAEYINPFLEACKDIVKQVCNYDINKGKLRLIQGDYPLNGVVISIAMTGDCKGEVIFNMDEKTAKSVASTMMYGMPVPELDEMSKSALSELGNMIMGKAASIFYNLGLVMDITPPKLMTGNQMMFFVKNSQTLCVPLELNNGGTIEVNVCTV